MMKKITWLMACLLWLLGQIAVVFMDEEGIGKLEAATTAEQIMDVFSDVEL